MESDLRPVLSWLSQPKIIIFKINAILWHTHFLLIITVLWETEEGRWATSI